MAKKTKSTGTERSKARGRNGSHHGRAKLRAPDEDGQKPETAGGCALRVNLASIGRHYQFHIRDTKKDESIVISRMFHSAKASKDALIALVKAIQADDFETFDLT